MHVGQNLVCVQIFTSDHDNLVEKKNRMDDVWLVLLQLLLVGTILGTLLTYLLRGLMCRATVEVGTKSVLITGCDTGYD